MTVRRTGISRKRSTARSSRRRAGLRRTSEGLADAIVEAVPDADTPVLMIVDQFEELFRYESGVSDTGAALPMYRDEAQSFATLMLTAIRSTRRRVHVLLTMRSDFIGECGRYRGLAEAVSASQYLVPAMVREQFAQAILGPLCVNGDLPMERWSETIEPALLPRLLNAASDERASDPLPVLQHALMRTWQVAVRRAGNHSRVVLTQNDYVRIGEIDRALSLHADEVLARAVREIQPAWSKAVALLEHLFRALTTVDVEGRAVRRPQTGQQLVQITGAPWPILRRAIHPFRAAGVSFLTPYAPAEMSQTTPIDVSHEALIRRWERIASTGRERDGSPVGWLARETEEGLLWRSLLVQARYEQSHLSPAVTRRVVRWFEALPTPNWTYRYFVPGLAGPGILAAQDTPSAAYDRVRNMLERSRAVEAEEDRRLKDAQIARTRERDRRIEVETSSRVATDTGNAALLESAWRLYRGWASAARSQQARAMRLATLGSALPCVAAAAGAVATIAASGVFLFAPFAASLATFFVGGVAAASLGGRGNWMVARAAAEAIKSECYRYAARAGDYGRGEAARLFVKRLEAFATAAELRGGVPIAVSDEEQTITGMPVPSMTTEWYRQIRLDEQREYLGYRAAQYAGSMRRAKLTAYGWAFGTALLALLAASGLGPSSVVLAPLVPLATTAGVSIALAGVLRRQGLASAGPTLLLERLSALEIQYDDKLLKAAEFIAAAENLLLAEHFAWREGAITERATQDAKAELATGDTEER
jgi:hypothetical protein